MVAARSGIRVNPASADLPISQRDEAGRQRLVAAGGILGALAASSCCIVPLILFSLGIGGAWIGNLTALAPYKPPFVAGTAGLPGYGHYLVYWKPQQEGADGAACPRPIPRPLVPVALSIAAVLH